MTVLAFLRPQHWAGKVHVLLSENRRQFKQAGTGNLMVRRIEILANLAFLLLCTVGIVLGVQAMSRPTPVVANGPPTPARSAPPLYQSGERITIDGVDFTAAPKTLLLVVRSTCRYCTDSMPFYKTLASAPTSGRRARIVALTPEAVEVGAEYFDSFGVKLDGVVSTPLTALKVRGTPTAILVSSTGVVEKVWQGRVDSKTELEVAAALRLER